MSLQVKEFPHIHGGLVNIRNCGHVNSAIQALLHVPMVQTFLQKDTEHRSACRSMLCSICALYKVMQSMQETGIANPEYFVKKWDYLSHFMREEMKTDSYEVLDILLSRLRMEYLQRTLSIVVPANLSETPITSMFELKLNTQGMCPVCGAFDGAHGVMSVVLASELSGKLIDDLRSHLWTKTEKECQLCKKALAGYETSLNHLPPNLIIHCKRNSPNFQLETQWTLQNCDYSLSCLIAEETPQQCIFVSMCPDGRFRHFEDTKVAVLSQGRLLNSDYLKRSRLTLIYSAKPKQTGAIKKTTEVTSRVTIPNRITQGIKIVSYPKLDNVDLYSDLPNDRTIGTQTEVPYPSTPQEETKKDSNDSKDEPLVSYNKCKNDERFKFFTALCKEDFEALYDLLGGEDMIRRMKLFYAQTTPQKIRKSKLSAKDRLFMFLLRLRRGLPLEELSYIFRVSVSYAGEICYCMTRLISLAFHKFEEEFFMSAAAQKKDMPKVMKAFGNLRIILDGFTIYTQRPSNLQQQGNTFSPYKGCNCYVFVIGVSTLGGTSFCTKGYEGHIKEKDIVLRSGFLTFLKKKDGVMSDRGFDLTAELQDIGCKFYQPPSLDGREFLTPEEEILTKGLASARIYSEHAIADIKDNRLLQGVVPLTLVPVLSDLVYIAAFMRNFSPSRVRDYKVVAEDMECDSFDSDVGQ